MKYLYPHLNARLERLVIVGAILILTLVLLVGCGGGSSGGIPEPVCRDSEGVEVNCSNVAIPPCAIFGFC